MAFILCPKCKKSISEKASQCVRCGHPIPKIESSALNGTIPTQRKPTPNQWVVLFAIFIPLGVAILWGAFSSIAENKRQADAHYNAMVTNLMNVSGISKEQAELSLYAFDQCNLKTSDIYGFVHDKNLDDFETEGSKGYRVKSKIANTKFSVVVLHISDDELLCIKRSSEYYYRDGKALQGF